MSLQVDVDIPEKDHTISIVIKPEIYRTNMLLPNSFGSPIFGAKINFSAIISYLDNTIEDNSLFDPILSLGSYDGPQLIRKETIEDTLFMGPINYHLPGIGNRFIDKKFEKKMSKKLENGEISIDGKLWTPENTDVYAIPVGYKVCDISERRVEQDDG